MCVLSANANIEIVTSLILQVTMDEDMAEEVEDLSKELEMMKDDENESEEHKIYRENIRLTGQDKYKTLRAVREGNSKRRIDLFENM